MGVSLQFLVVGLYLLEHGINAGRLCAHPRKSEEMCIRDSLHTAEFMVEEQEYHHDGHERSKCQRAACCLFTFCLLYTSFGGCIVIASSMDIQYLYAYKEQYPKRLL